MSAAAWREIQADIVPRVGKDNYNALLKPTFRETVTAYINVSSACDKAIGKSFRPLGSTETGGKLFKIRLAVPGYGSSGGLRVVAALHCDTKSCHILLAKWRRDFSKPDEETARGRDWKE